MFGTLMLMECRVMHRMVSRLSTPLALLASLLAALTLAGCQGTLGLEPALAAASSTEEAEEETAAEGRRHVGEPYQVRGRWYHPKEDEDYDETGLASWYGNEFHGARTANGERFDPSMLTAAHPTLPLPSFVRVTNLKNNKTAVVRVNDRGPFKQGRIVDVSRAAAEKLEFRRAGSAQVRVEYLGAAPLGGGDEETLVAEAKFGTTAEGGRSGIARFLPFGRGETNDEPEGRPVEVRLASAGPARAGGGLPGVTAPVAVVRAPEPMPEPVAVASTAAVPTGMASAYQAADDDIDALIALNSEPAETEPSPAPQAAPAAAAVAAPAPAPLRAPAPEPLRAAAPEEAESRILGAHDLFAAIDSSSGGAGELNGIQPVE